MKKFWFTIRSRWTNTMPKFFRIICWVCSLISGTALAINTAITAGGGIPHLWWSDIYPYLLGIPAGMAFVAKFTQTYSSPTSDYPDRFPTGHHPHAHDRFPTASAPESPAPDEEKEVEMFEILPYDDRPDA